VSAVDIEGGSSARCRPSREELGAAQPPADREGRLHLKHRGGELAPVEGRRASTGDGVAMELRSREDLGTAETVAGDGPGRV
jgi:hypothetical protein